MDRYTKPDFDSVALVTIDTQCDVLDGQPLEIQGTSAVLPNMALLLEAFRAFKRPIVHIVRIYNTDGSNADLCRKDAIENGRAMFLTDTDGCQIASPLLPGNTRLDSQRLLFGGIQLVTENEVIIYKPRWGAFYGTALQEHLVALGVSTLLFTGCNFPNCPRTSIYEASERDYRIGLVTDAISGLYERGAAELQGIGVTLYTTQEVLENMQK